MIYIDVDATKWTRDQMTRMAFTAHCVLHTWKEATLETRQFAIIAASKEADADLMIDTLYGMERGALDDYTVDDPETQARKDFFEEVGTADGEKVGVSYGEYGENNIGYCLLTLTHGDAPMSTAYLEDEGVRRLIHNMRAYLEAK